MGGRGTEPPEAHSGPLRPLEILPLVPTPGWQACSPSSWAAQCVYRAPGPPLTVPPPITAASAAVTPSGLGASGPHLPYICQTILYQTCKPSGMLRALNFYEILGSVIVRQTPGLVTNSPPFNDTKASPRDAWSPRGWPSSGAVEIDEDSMHPGEINALELRGQDCGASGGSAGKGAQPWGACCPSSLILASGGGLGDGTQRPPSCPAWLPPRVRKGQVFITRTPSPCHSGP